MSAARKRLDWEGQIGLSLYPDKAKQMRSRFSPGTTCTMCGPYCALALVNDYLGASAPTDKC